MPLFCILLLLNDFYYICIVKRVFVISVILFSVLLLACGKQQEPVVEQPLPFIFDENLQQIDSLMQHDADSALMSLTSFRPTEGSREISSTFNTNYQSLLISEALYKTYNPQLNRYRNETFQETSLHEAVQYFDSLYICYPKNDDLALLLARSHYMNGVGYYENDSVVDACKEYLKTLEIMENHFDDSELIGYKAKFMGLTYTRLGELFFNNSLAVASLESYKNALHYFNKADNYNLANPYRAIASSYHLYQQPDSALFYYRKARSIAKTTNKSFVYSSALSESAPIYYDLGYVDSAFMMIKEALLRPINEDARLAQYHTIGYLYFKERLYDSAIIYLEQSIKRNSYATQTSSSELLMDCYQALGDTIKASYYKGIYGNNFSIYRNNAEITTELTKLYDDYQQKRLDKENLLKRRRQNRIFSIVIVVVLLLIAGIIVISRIKVRKTIDKSKIDIADRDRALEDLKRRMQANPFIKEPIFQTISRIVNAYQFKSKVSFEHYKEHELSKDQLLALREAVDRCFDNFTKKLSNNYPKLSYDDVDYCCLYLLGLKNAEISALMQCSYRAVCDRNNKLKNIFNTKHTITDFLYGIINNYVSN